MTAARRTGLLRLGLGLALLAGLFVLGRWAGGEVPRLAAWIDGLGWLGPVAFVAVYALATVALVPGAILTLVAGAVFGLAEGTGVAFVAATIGAALAFLVARYVARGLVEKRLAGRPRFAAVDRAVARRGFRIVFLLRLSPVFPFSVLNYALGLTGVRFGDYLLASLGMLPGTLLYVYYGKVAGDVATLAGRAHAPTHGIGYYVVLGIGLAATVAVTAMVARLARRALRETADV